MKEESLFCDPAVEIYTTTHTEMLFYTLQRAISGISYHDANRIRERGGEKKRKKKKRERRRSRNAVTRYVNRRRRWQQQQQRSLIIFIEYDDDIL
jgi:hypothetical protein